MYKAVTDARHTKRELFTDDNDIIYEHKRCLGLDGINVALTEADAIEGTAYHLNMRILMETREKRNPFYGKNLKKIKPLSFLYILDVIVIAMQKRSVLKDTSRIN